MIEVKRLAHSVVRLADQKLKGEFGAIETDQQQSEPDNVPRIAVAPRQPS